MVRSSIASAVGYPYSSRSTSMNSSPLSPREPVALADVAADAVSHVHQTVIAGLVPVLIVDRFKVVQIQDL